MDGSQKRPQIEREAVRPNHITLGNLLPYGARLICPIRSCISSFPTAIKVGRRILIAPVRMALRNRHWAGWGSFAGKKPGVHCGPRRRGSCATQLAYKREDRVALGRWSAGSVMPGRNDRCVCVAGNPIYPNRPQTTNTAKGQEKRKNPTREHKSQKFKANTYKANKSRSRNHGA